MNWKRPSFICVHAGLLTILVFALLSFFFNRTYQMKLYKSVENNIYYSEKTGIKQLPYSLELQEITMEKDKFGSTVRVSAIIKYTGENPRMIKVREGRPYLYNNGSIAFETVPEIGYDNCELLIEYRPFRYYIYLGMIVLIYGCLQMFSDIRTNKRNHNEDSLKVNLARIITSLSTICLVVAIAFKLSLWLIVLFMLITLVAGWYLHAKKLKSENVGA